VSVAGTRVALQTLNATITGVTSAPANYPGAINTADMPMALVWPGPAESRAESIGALRRQDRTWVVRVYVDAVNQGLGKHEVWQTAEVLLQRFIEAYLNSANVVLDNNGAQATISTAAGDITDGGLQVLTYPPGLPLDAAPAYYGLEVRVRVYEKW